MRIAGRLCVAGCLLYAASAGAILQTRLELGTLNGTGWQAKGVALSFTLNPDDSFSVVAQAAQLTLPGLKQPVRDLSLSCPRLIYNAQRLACSEGTLRLSYPGLELPPLALRFEQARAEGAFFFELDNLAFAQGLTRAEARRVDGGWRLDLSASLDSEKLWRTAGALFELPDWTLAGALALNLQIETGDQLRMQAQIAGEDLSFSNAEATQAGEGLKLSAELALMRQDEMLTVQGDVQWQQGDLYIAPIYVQQNGPPVTLSLDLDWNGKNRQLQLAKLHYHDPALGTLHAQGGFDLAQGLSVRELTLHLPALPLAQLQQRYLSAWLEEKELTDLRLQGTLGGDLSWNGQGGALRLDLAKVDIQDRPKARFAVNGLHGTLHWQSRGQPENAPPTRLSWTDAVLSNIALPTGHLDLGLAGSGLHLLSPLRLPILDGSLFIDQFSLHGGTEPEMYFSGTLRPISMQLLTRALALPELGGQISGTIPGVRYRDNFLDLSGALVLKVFDGDIIIHHLNLRQALGPQPELNAEVAVKNLDLNTLTRFFEFGDISGRLSGYIKNLRVRNWRPTAFDAYFATPEGDGSKHRISQKAVNNLSRLGGSEVAAALSRSILRIFEEFSYDRIGWGCRLENGVCEMYGTQSAPGGYYIVKGGGLPRIDVIGYNQRVDWDELLLRLKRVTGLKTGTPTVQK